MIDSGASVNVGPKWFAESSLQESDGSVQIRGADGRTLKEHGKRQIWLKIGNNVRLPCGGSDEADPECQLSVRERNRNTPRRKVLV